MDENKELLTLIYQDADMGISSLTTLIRKLNKTDNKIKKVVEGELKGYEEFLKKTKKMMKEYKFDIDKKSIVNKLGSTMGINMEFMKDNSDSRVADMLIQGFTMGVLSISKKIDNFSCDAKKDIINLAKDFRKFQQENVEMLKKYL